MRRKRLGSGYARLFCAYMISNVGNGVLIAALPLLAAGITRHPLAISGLTVAAGLPWVLVGPFSGAIVDRVDRRRAMVVAESGRAVIVGLGAVYVLLGGQSILVLYAMLILIGVGETFFDPAGLALLPSIVAPSQLDRANARLFGSQILAQRFVGPPLGGWLFALAAWAPLGLDAVSFLVSALVVMMIPRAGAPGGSDRAVTGLASDMVEGLGWLWRDSALRAFVLGAAAFHFSTAAGTSVLVLIAQDRFGLSGSGFGLTLGGLALGYFVGYLAAPSTVNLFPRAGMCVVSLIGASCGFLMVAGSGTAVVAGLGLALVGLSASQHDIVSISYRQAAVPDRLRGRVMAGFLFVVHGAVPVGAAFGGLVAAGAGVGYTYVGSAVAVAAVAPVIWRVLKDTELDPGRLSGETEGP